MTTLLLVILLPVASLAALSGWAGWHLAIRHVARTGIKEMERHQ